MNEQNHEPHQAIARANLLRMRGNLDEARQLLESVLDSDPRNVEAHEMMGDLAVQRAQLAPHPAPDLQNAVHWYDLTLGIDPTNSFVTGKANDVRSRIRDHEAAETVRRLGIPTNQSNLVIFMVATGLFVVCIALAGWFAGRWIQDSRAKPTIYQEPISVSLPEPVRTEAVPSQPTPTADQAPAPPASTPSTSSTPASSEDAVLLAKLKALPEFGGNIMTLMLDPRGSRSAVVTMTSDPQRVSEIDSWTSQAAQAIFAADSSLGALTLRVLDGTELFYVADFVRADTPSSEKVDPPVPSNTWSQPKPGDGN